MDLNEIQKRMHKGKLYYSGEQSLVNEQLKQLDLLYDYNNSRPSEQDKREKLLKEMFLEIGENCYIEPPLHSNWAGKHVSFGKNIYANFNLTLVDDTYITVGDSVMFGPNVTICTATHPIHLEIRYKKAQYNLPITIEDNVWIGGHAMVFPGVTIGKNSIIGAGSIVTKDIPPNVVALGTPAKVLREIDENDRKYYEKTRLVDIE